MNNIYDFDITELESIVNNLGYKPYRASQIFSGLYKGHDLEEITVLPQELKLQLKEKYILTPIAIYKEYKAKDGTIKYLLQLNDDNLIECVFIKNNYGNTLCVSTQVGCGMGCAFCASG
ncbi:MAG: 23S rRNA (adenine(2503)-C(2))-methyltransferase RlmN, partial [Clostridia bacterium]|nr:23S rRNA (adenine(2503)-C(2))-methyltransferase RlmN [Clostridia bacterium]